MKRLLAFLLLLTIGSIVLLFAVGDDPAAKANTQAGKTDDKPTPPPPRVDIGKGGVAASIAQSGKLDVPEWREVQLGDGRVRRERVFVLHALDSQPIAQGLQQLDGVTVELFENDKHGGTIEARQAFAELQRDANGRPTFAQSKTIDLRDAVFYTLPESRYAGLRLELGSVKATVEADEIVLRSPVDQAVLMTLDGEHRATLKGTGVQARLPRSQNGALHRLDVELLRDPDLESEGMHVHAAGRMHYVEDTVSGAAMITLDDDVHLDLGAGRFAVPGLSRARRPGVGAIAAERAEARGDQFTGWLNRLRNRDAAGREHQELSWERALLTGAPARIDVPGGAVTTPRLCVLPGITGEPVQITAFGGESRLTATDLGLHARPDVPIVATARRRTHLVRPGEYVGSIHRAFGFPAWSLRGLDQLQLVICEGQAHLDNGERSIEAGDGVRVLRRDGADTGIVEGLGEVRFVQRPARAGEPELVATGSDGFLLRMTPTSEELRLGPDARDAARFGEHRFAVEYGRDRIDGRGGCAVTRTAERTHLVVTAAGGDVHASVPEQGLALDNVIRLDADVDTAADALRALTADGLPLRASLRHGQERVTATAPHLEQIGPRSLRLLPAPAGDDPVRWPGLAANDRAPVLRRELPTGEGVELRGPPLDIHHVGGHDVLLDAEAVGDDHPHVYATLPQPGRRTPMTIACEAQRLRLLPFVVTRQAQRAWFAGAPGPAGDLAMSALAKPWLLVDDVLDFQLDDEANGHNEGRAHRLLVSQGGQAALFVGDPDGAPAFVRQRHGAREVITEGARVRVFRDDGVQLQALSTYDGRSLTITPTVTLHEAGSDGLLSHMRATCRGDIDVLADAVAFGGPVLVRGIHSDGSDDPDGINIDASTLHLTRIPDTGRPATVDAHGVRLTWSRLTAAADRLELDLRPTHPWCVVTGEPEARIELPNGTYYCAPRLEVNYETLALRSFRVHGGLRSPAPTGNPAGTPPTAGER